MLQPRVMTERLVRTQPPMMNGLRRPSLDLHPSERTPTRGWTINPERGPARKTTDIMLLLTPSESKNGEALHAGGDD